MTRFVVGDDRSQSTLFPERLDDYLSEDNPVRAIDVFVDELDLAKLGFDPGAPDGVLGRKSRAALRQYQESKALAADGFATTLLLAMLDKDAASR